jgi:hypothetical protein
MPSRIIPKHKERGRIGIQKEKQNKSTELKEPLKTIVKLFLFPLVENHHEFPRVLASPP